MIAKIAQITKCFTPVSRTRRTINAKSGKIIAKPNSTTIIPIGVLSAIAGVGAQNNQWLTSPIGIIVVLFGLAIILPDFALIVRRVRDTGVKHLVIWAILAIIFNIVGFIFALIPTDQFKN